MGHSQGTGVLRRLIREEIDADPALRARLVSALLLGGNVLVKTGTDRGGDFEHVPLCTKARQFGCVVAYSTFLDDPPDNAIFGRAPTGPDPLTGQPPRDDVEVACVNPASLSANLAQPLTSYLTSEPFAAGLILVAIIQTYGGPTPAADTPWVQPADRYTGRCEHINGAHVFKVTPLGSARHLNAAPDPSWGLHITDVNGALGDLVALVNAQSGAYIAAHERPRLRLKARCNGKVRVLGRDRGVVRSVKVVKRGKHRVRARVTLDDGSRLTLRARVPRCN
jgi:hypothetical protein